jgi:hypothetical protein
MRSEVRALVVLACCAGLAGCYPSNVVSSTDRAVRSGDAVAQLAWRACTAADLAGFFASRSIEGDAALSLKKVFYVFLDGGRYTGAALVDADDGLSFQTLGGSYVLEGGMLALDGAAGARCEAADGGFLRIAMEGGAIVLCRVEDA